MIEYEHTTKQGAIQFARNISEGLEKLQAKKRALASPVYEFLGRTNRWLESELEIADRMPAQPIALLECAKCHTVYEVPVGEMSQGSGDIPNRCGHWEPAIFRGLKLQP